MASKPTLRSLELEEATLLEHIKLIKGGVLTTPANSELNRDRVSSLRLDVPRITPERVLVVDRHLPPVLLV